MSRVAVTGATGLVGRRLVAALAARGDEVTALSRNPERASEALGVQAVGWDPMSGPAPTEALEGRDVVVNLAGEPVAQRWNDRSKERIRESRVTGTRNLVAALTGLDARPSALVNASGIGAYGDRGDDIVDEDAPFGSDFLSEVVAAWEAAADRSTDLGLRVVALRTGVVLDARDGALKKMLPPFKAGVGGPVGGGKQWMPWIHGDDIIGLYLAAIDNESWSGAFNACSPNPVTNADFSKALGKTLHRPAVMPVPSFALKAMFGEMAEIILGGQRALPKRALEHGYDFAHPELREALAATLG